MPEYRFQFDETFLIHAFCKYRQQRGVRYFLLALKWLATPLFLILAVFSAWQVALWPAVILVAPVALLHYGHFIDHWLIRRRFRKSPYWNDSIVSCLTDDGMHVVGAHSESKFSWSVFTKARGLQDGLLLFQGPGLFFWLPDAALSDGTRTDVESLVKAQVKDYYALDSNQPD